MKSRDIADKMMSQDAFSQLLGMEIVEMREGNCVVEMLVSEKMTNGFGIAHGGITYALADSALAFAANGEGKIAVSVETNISHFTKVMAGDVLRAFAQKLHRSNKIGVYEVKISNQRDENVAVFKGTVYISAKEW